jgi:tetratricopeptide (TPR) repeat protein
MKIQDPPIELLQPIVNLFNNGKLQQALSDTSQLLEKFPNSLILCNISGASNAGLMQFDDAIESYKKALEIKPDYPEAYYNMGIALKNQGNLDAAIDNYKKALDLKPNYVEAYFNMGNLLKDKGDFEAAIDSYKKALEIKSDYPEAYYNMGIALKNQGNLDAAIDSYKKVLELKPHYVEAYFNMGNILKDKGDFEAAIESYNNALEIDPDYVEVNNNLGIAFKDKGDFEAAIDSFNKALEINPDYVEAKENLLSLIASYSPQKENLNLIVKVNEEISKIKIRGNILKIISDDQVVNLFSRSEDCITSFGLELKTKQSQVFRYNSVNLDCTRHKSIFDKNEIIPEFCFGCYKVEVEPRSIIELIKLFIVFDQLELVENNTRKCMVELRPEISGFYKGLIFCSGLKQANLIADHLDKIIKQSIGLGLSSSVKRGCSEYAISYPDYKKINQSGPQLMNFNNDWKVFEDSHDRKNSIYFKKTVRKSLNGLNLSDILIIRNWIDYAKGINDPSANLLSQNTVYYQNIYDQAKARLNHFNLITL